MGNCFFIIYKMNVVVFDQEEGILYIIRVKGLIDFKLDIVFVDINRS